MLSPRGAAGHLCLAFCLSGGEALDKLAEGIRPSLIVILSDINMPGMDGLQLLVEIKQRFPDLPVMMVTAYSLTVMTNDGGRRRSMVRQRFLPSRSTLSA